MTDPSAPFANRVFAVTGGASGMGAATVRELAHRGASAIHIADWNTANFSSLKDEIRSINPATKIHTKQLDVSKVDEVNAWIEGVVKVSGGLHGAANLAGIGQSPTDPSVLGNLPGITAESDDVYHRIIGVNLNGMYYCTRAQVRAMARMPKGSNPAIVNVASSASINHYPTMFAYGISKAGVAHLSITVAKDVERFGIRCNAVSPGNIHTPMSATFAGGEQNLKEKMKPGGNYSKMIEPANVAKTIVWLLSDGASHVNGVNLMVGMTMP